MSIPPTSSPDAGACGAPATSGPASALLTDVRADVPPAALPGLVPLHGGPDALGVPRWDFSTNANACGPAPGVVEVLARVDARHYPDPGYHTLREQLARLHRVDPCRIVPAASASEFIQRLSTAMALCRPGARVRWPVPGYGDYGRAAAALGLQADDQAPDLCWHTEPSSPLGRADAPPPRPAAAVLVVDRAYAPLRLEGRAPELPAAAWQLWSPNKALGLTGVRGAYAIAPEAALAHAESLGEASPDLQARLLQRVQALAPSWPLGAHAVGLLECWAGADTQAWVRDCLPVLRRWKQAQVALLQHAGWQVQASVTPFLVARAPHWPAGQTPAALLAGWRERGLKLRDTTSMGLPGWVRLSVQPPAAQAALAACLGAAASPSSCFDRNCA
ncbi:histidinol-phosphate aminotransferase [Sphaerotilus hippei]|uniref:Histidinol-phosphate aminotransferase n=1 Tax=Sphaerotilus hippei TaxID=744406 RepID=A0A318GVT9_9BURK|nr:aminotransferase [Sphaerotilus hippei]PXW93275.1 histidinol-phosphate aminotransferase [Sphaerotilus hippei]